MKFTRQGYFHQPTIYGHQVIFVSEDQLWSVSLSEKKAVPITHTRGAVSHPHYSPDGKWVAFTGKEEGISDVYVMSSQGGSWKRMTFFNTLVQVIGWDPESKNILFRSAHQAIHRSSDAELYSVPVAGGAVSKLPFGPACTLHYEPNGKRLLLGRNASSNSHWKRYRGGTQGEVWISTSNQKKFEKLFAELQGNPVSPFWLATRIYFVSDHEGIGNLYSSHTDGTDLRKETQESEFYVRDPQTNGKVIVYQCGADLKVFDPETQVAQILAIEGASTQTQLQRQFFYGDQYLEDASLHPSGERIAINARGKLFAMPLWEQAVSQYGQRNGVRYRLHQWLQDGRLVTLSDESGTEQLAIFQAEPKEKPERLIDLPEGYIQEMISSPTKNQIVFTTSRLALYLMDISKKRSILLDSSPAREIQDITFSPDGNWVAYAKPLSIERTAIFLVNVTTKKTTQVTNPIRYDFCPCFDPKGKHLYFLGARSYNPLMDSVQFSFSFAKSVKPYCITLREDLPNPLTPAPRVLGKTKDKDSEDDSSKEQEERDSKKESADKDQKERQKESVQPIVIDVKQIQQRIVEIPVAEGVYTQLTAVADKILFSEFPLQTAFGHHSSSAYGSLQCYDFEKLESEELSHKISWFDPRIVENTMLYRVGDHLRVVEAGSSIFDEEGGAEHPQRKNGWIDLRRIRFAVEYAQEWKQMLREAWRLQKEFFWTADLANVDWEEVWKRYSALLPRIHARSELSDLIWEMQGELGTSHAYEWGGDYLESPYYSAGKLGADWSYDQRKKQYVIQKIYRGDIWKTQEHSPFAEPGCPVEEGDSILSIGGLAVNEHTSPEELLIQQAGQTIAMKIQKPQKKAKKQVVFVQSLPSDQKARYRDWIHRNLQTVEEKTAGVVGYLHIPDMQTRGISEFHRGFLAQTDKQGLIIDVRYNAGGMVSPLILEKLAHQHLGYDISRWGQAESYPYHTLRGHLLVLCNEFTGSDGDMFCYAFQALQLGKVIGKRTWGGVIGIDGRYQLVDETTTTQPQYAIWFHQDGWTVENQGVQPDIEIEYAPQDYLKGDDPQLAFAIKEMKRLLEEEPIPKLELSPPPSRKLP